MLAIYTFRKMVLFLLISFLPFLGIAQNESNLPIPQKIDQLFKDIKENEPGAAIGVIQNGQVIYKKGFGLANLDYDIPITTSSIFEVGALSMHVTGACILLLENEGKLSLDDPIQKYLTDFPKYAKGQPTIRQCFHHTSGLRDFLEMLNMSGQSTDIPYTAAEAVELIKKQTALTIVPGSDYRYSHSGYLVLAAIVEQISGQSLANFAKENIFVPLEMNHTFFADTKGQIIKNRAVGYQKEEEQYKVSQPFNFLTPGPFQLHTNIDDFIKWMLNFKKSTIGGENFMQQMHTKGITNYGDTMSYAVGIEHGKFRGRSSFGHNGYWEGSTAMFLEFYEDDLSVITLSNNGSLSAPRFAFQTVRLFIEEKQASAISKPSLKKDPLPATVKLAKKQKEAFCGNYFNDGIGYNRKVYLKNDTLWYSDFESPDSWLTPIAPNKFKTTSTNNNTLRFEMENNKPILYFQYGERPALRFNSYQPANYTDSTLQQFTGVFSSQELGVDYTLKIVEKEIVIYLKGKELVKYAPLTTDIFNSPHDGFLKFSRDKNGRINGFSLTDYWLGKIDFSKK